MAACEKQVAIYPASNAGAPIVYLPVAAGMGDDVLQCCRDLGCPPFTLVAIGGLDWNRELSVWPCDAITATSEPFAGEAAAFLHELTHKIIPTIEAPFAAPPRLRAIAGYSLAGLLPCGHAAKPICLAERQASQARCGFPVLPSTSTRIFLKVPSTSPTSPWAKRSTRPPTE